MGMGDADRAGVLQASARSTRQIPTNDRLNPITHSSMVPDRRDGDPGEPSLVELVFPHDVADGLPHIVESLLEILGGQIIGGQAGLGELGLHVGIGEGFL